MLTREEVSQVRPEDFPRVPEVWEARLDGKRDLPRAGTAVVKCRLSVQRFGLKYRSILRDAYSPVTS